MEASSFQKHPFHNFDSHSLPLPCFHEAEQMNNASFFPQDPSDCRGSNGLGDSMDDTFVSEKQQTDCNPSSISIKNSQVMDRKRKSRGSNSANSRKPMRRKKCSSGGTDEEERHYNCDERKEKASEEQPSNGYIHVRARRGQATDRHSLSERVRRLRINERMKLLQTLVPGCDKVSGKALLLDEIINYVQSLQNQVEFLSMKLASLTPVIYDLNADLHNALSKPEKTRTSRNQSSTTSDSTAGPLNFTPGNSYPNFLGASAAPFLQGEMASTFSSQDVIDPVWAMDEQRGRFITPAAYSDLYSFN